MKVKALRLDHGMEAEGGDSKGHLRCPGVSSWVIPWCHLLRWGFQNEDQF